MRRLFFLVALALLTTTVLLSPIARGQAGQNVTVEIEDNYFEEADITVPVGTTVTWVQTGNNSHTTTSYDGLWDSGLLPGGSGESFSYTFYEPGTFAYFCHIHPFMMGSVTVSGGAEASSS